MGGGMGGLGKEKKKQWGRERKVLENVNSAILERPMCLYSLTLIQPRCKTNKIERVKKKVTARSTTRDDDSCSSSRSRAKGWEWMVRRRRRRRRRRDTNNFDVGRVMSCVVEPSDKRNRRVLRLSQPLSFVLKILDHLSLENMVQQQQQQHYQQQQQLLRGSFVTPSKQYCVELTTFISRTF
ncbi:hypothetical protein M0804_011952 [Polistes exclamans]|nr:hypothetical protein M0804_011952 [Polistes exclamans]